MQCVGASGRGKSKFIEDLIRQDILGNDKPGVFVLDPHGTLYDDLVAWCDWNRVNKERKIHLINPSEEGWSVGFNPLRLDGSIEPSVRIDSMVNACAQVWGGEDSSRTPLLKKCLRAVFYALAVNDCTLLEATDLVSVSDPHYIRQFLTRRLDDRVFQAVWDDFNAMAIDKATKRQFIEQFSSANNRLMEFLSSPTIRNIVGQKQNVVDFRSCMEHGDVVLLNLAPSSRLSLDNARLLGTLMLNDILLTALTRDPKTAQESPFYVYIDEAYQFLTQDVESMLDQTRKFGVHLILSHQRLGQLREAGEGIYNAVMTGAQTKVVFGGLTFEDAKEMAADIFLGELDLEEGIEITKNPMVVAQRIIELESSSQTEGVAETKAGASVTSEGTVYNEDGDVVNISEGSTESASWSTTYASSVTHGRQQTLAGVFEERYSGVHSLENQLYKVAAALVNQARRHAFVKVPGHHSARIKVREVKGPFVEDERRDRFTDTLLNDSPYTTPLLTVQDEISSQYSLLKKRAFASVYDAELSKDSFRKKRTRRKSGDDRE
jgi:hypothetical protein